MAITNAQQYKQILQKEREEKAFGGLMGIDGRKAYVGGSYSGKDPKGGNQGAGKYQGGSGVAGSAESKGMGGEGGYNRDTKKVDYGKAEREFQQKLARDNARRNQTKTKVTTKTRTKDKPNFLKFLNPFSKEKRKFNYNLFTPNMFGIRDNVIADRQEYIDKLIEAGIDEKDIPASLYNKEDLAEFGVEGAYNFKPTVLVGDKGNPNKGAGYLKNLQTYPEFQAYDKGSPGMLYSGNVGGLEKFVSEYEINPDGTRGKPLKYGYREERGGGRDDSILPIAQAPSITEPEVTGYVNPLSLLTPRIAGTRFLGTEFEDEEDIESAANGGRIGAMGGGIMNTDVMGGLADGGMDESGRQMYFLGKLVKKATRAVKKIAKSPIGKAALIGGLGYLGATKMGGMKGLSSFFGKGSFNPFKTLIPNVGKVSSPFGALASKFGMTDLITGDLTGLGKGALYAGLPAIIAGLTTPKEDENEFDIDAYYAANRLNPNAPLNRRILGTDFYAADGGMPSKEPVAKKTMPLLDMDGQEMDLRAEGGFVPLGRMERADDVPARLSKNEFVFTADAVRNAGEGDIDKGAEVMYNMMKNLESGGEVSEESQGLEGAREMFQTSQRLEEVI